MQRPTRIVCEMCGQSAAVASRGRIAASHPACRDLENDLARISRAVERACASMPWAARRALRRKLLSQMFHEVNVAFNGRAPDQRGGATAAGMAAAAGGAE